MCEPRRDGEASVPRGRGEGDAGVRRAGERVLLRIGDAVFFMEGDAVPLTPGDAAPFKLGLASTVPLAPGDAVPFKPGDAAPLKPGLGDTATPTPAITPPLGVLAGTVAILLGLGLISLVSLGGGVASVLLRVR